MEEITFDPIESRRQEVLQYEANIVMFKSIYESLPKEWPEHLEQFRGAKFQHQAIDKVEDMADVELLSKLWYADEVHRSIRSETVEMTKAKAILIALELSAK